MKKFQINYLIDKRRRGYESTDHNLSEARAIVEVNDEMAADIKEHGIYSKSFAKSGIVSLLETICRDNGGVFFDICGVEMIGG